MIYDRAIGYRDRAPLSVQVCSEPPSLAARNIHFLGPVVRHTRSSEECPGSGIGQRVVINSKAMPKAMLATSLPPRASMRGSRELLRFAKVQRPQSGLTAAAVEHRTDGVLAAAFIVDLHTVADVEPVLRAETPKRVLGAGRRSEETDR